MDLILKILLKLIEMKLMLCGFLLNLLLLILLKFFRLLSYLDILNLYEFCKYGGFFFLGNCFFLKYYTDEY